MFSISNQTTMIKKFFTAFFLLSTIASLSFAQDNSKFKLETGLDLANTYLWRGFEFGNGPVVQPWTQLTYQNATAGIWATTNFTGDSKEVDLYLKYTLHNFTLSFTDLFTVVNNGLNQNYFDFNNASTDHVSELGLSFNGSEKFPFLISGGILMYGQKTDPGTEGMNHSVYGEVAYPGSFKEYTYSVFAGFVPFASSFYQTEKFSFINIGLNVGKTLQITNEFSIPINFTLSTSPERKSICFAVKCSL